MQNRTMKANYAFAGTNQLSLVSSGVGFGYQGMP